MHLLNIICILNFFVATMVYSEVLFKPKLLPNSVKLFCKMSLFYRLNPILGHHELKLK